MNLDERLTRALKIVALLVLGLALGAAALLILSKILPVVIIVVGAVFFAYLIYPAVAWLQRHRVARWLAITFVYIVLAGLLFGVGSFLGPRIGTEARTFTQDYPKIVNQVRDAVINAHTSFLAKVPIESRQTAVRFLDELVLQLQKVAGGVASQALKFALSVATVIAGVIIVPFLAFYILLDLDRLRNGAVGLFPARYRTQTLQTFRDVDGVLGAFIRGQVIVAAVVATAVTVLLLILRIPYAFLIGVFAGIADIIPYVGAIAGAIPAVIIALLLFGIKKALLVIVGFAAIYELEGHLVAPFVVGHRVGLPPLLVIVFILAGAELGGVIGMLVAVPVAAIARVLWNRFTGPQVVTERVELAAQVAAKEAQAPASPTTAEKAQAKIIIAGE